MGVARTDITPPVGVYSRNWGAADHDTAQSIHRPLTLTALVLQSTPQETPLVLLDADLGWWKTPATFHRFISDLRSALAVDTPQLLIALSHTHAGPPLMDAEENLPGSELLHDWMIHLHAAAVNVVRAARNQMFAGRLDWHRGHCSLASNRDLPDPEGIHRRTICGFNPQIAADETLYVGRLVDQSGEIRATLTNYACHPTTLAWDNLAISPDYVGAMRETIEDFTKAPAIFLLGACGDLAPRYQYVGDTAVADRHGRCLGYATLATLLAMEPPGQLLAYRSTVESGAPLAVWQHHVFEGSRCLQAALKHAAVPLKNWPSADQLEMERASCTDRAIEERLRRKRDIRRGLGDGQTYPLPIYIWRLGDVVLVGCCAEPYSILQRELRQRFREKTILVMNLINGSIGYLPPASLYETDVYPVWQTPFDRGSLELVVDTMTEAIHHVLKD